MQLTTIGNRFYFNLPTDFLPTEVEEKWLRILHKNHVLYASTLEYLTSTLQDVVFPSVTFETPKQTKHRGKEVQWKDAKNIYDSMSKTVELVFKSVDSNLNYLIMWDALNSTKLDTNRTNDSNMFLFVLDRHKDVIIQATFRSVILTGITDIKFSFGDNVGENKTFTVSFTYNYLDIVSPIDNRDLLTNDKSIEARSNPVPNEPARMIGADVKPFSFRKHTEDEYPDELK